MLTGSANKDKMRPNNAYGGLYNLNNNKEKFLKKRKRYN